MSRRDKTEVTIDFKTGDKEIPKDSEGTTPVKCANVTFLIFRIKVCVGHEIMKLKGPVMTRHLFSMHSFTMFRKCLHVTCDECRHYIEG